MRYEVTIDIINKDYVDTLIVALARQGFSPYVNEEDNIVGFSVNEENLTKIRYEKIEEE